MNERMNERIRELAEQVMHTDPNPHLSVELYCFTKSEFEKFAELIVRECADICYNRNYAIGSAYGDAIAEHFGVEL